MTEELEEMQMVRKMTIRTSGVVLIAAANLLLLLSLLFALFPVGIRNTEKEIGVLCVSSPSARFPEYEYQSVFAGLGLSGSFIRMEPTDDENFSEEIRILIESKKYDSLILMAYGDSAALGLRAASNEDLISGLILLSPVFGEFEVLETFGSMHPDTPVAIFSGDSEVARQLYERLSGEDALISKGLSSSKLFASEVRISPDARRYLSVRELTGDTVIDTTIHSYFPAVQLKIGEYIKYHLIDESAELSDVRGFIFLNQVVKVAAAAMLLGGLFLFLATISKGERVEKRAGGNFAQREISTPPEISLYAKIDRSEKYLFGLIFPIAIVVATILSILTFTMPEYAIVAAAAWPVIGFGMAALFYLKHLRNMPSTSKAVRGRVLYTIAVAFLFATGVFQFYVLHVSSIQSYISYPRGWIVLFSLIILGASTIVCQRTDTFFAQTEQKNSHRKGFLSAWRFRGIILLPFISMLVSSFLSQQTWMFILSLYFIAVLLISDWFRRKVKRMSGTVVLPAILSVILYITLTFV